MPQEKLSALSIMCIESDKLHSLSFQDIINDYVLEKLQKMPFYSSKLTYCPTLSILALKGHFIIPMLV
jgi:hypothetical protein